MAGLPYESFTIMDLYCSVHEMYEENDSSSSKEKKRSNRRNRHQRKKSSVDIMEPRESPRRTSGNRKKSSSSSMKAALRMLAQQSLPTRKQSLTAHACLDGAPSVGGQDTSESQKKFSGAEGARRDSLVNYLKEMEIDTVAKITRRPSH